MITVLKPRLFVVLVSGVRCKVCFRESYLRTKQCLGGPFLADLCLSQSAEFDPEPSFDP